MKWNCIKMERLEGKCLTVFVEYCGGKKDSGIRGCDSAVGEVEFSGICQ